MNADQVFEILNHSLTSKDTTELMGIVTSVECFRSPTLGNDKIVVGNKAPEAFRTSLAKMMRSKDIPSLSISYKIGDDRNAVYVMAVKNKKTNATRALTIGLRGANLISFVETDAG